MIWRLQKEPQFEAAGCGRKWEWVTECLVSGTRVCTSDMRMVIIYLGVWVRSTVRTGWLAACILSRKLTGRRPEGESGAASHDQR